MQTVQIGKAQVATSDVLRSYWVVATERQRIYHARLGGQSRPWTEDPVLQRFRFTNAYRASDRVSQDLIRVIYDGPQRAEDLLFRVLLYRFFNRPTTWQVLENAVDTIEWSSYDNDRYAGVLDQELAGDAGFTPRHTLFRRHRLASPANIATTCA